MDCTAHGSINASSHRVKSEKKRRAGTPRMLLSSTSSRVSIVL